MKTIVIVRTSTYILDFKSYNCQELGLARALQKRGYKVAIITPDKIATHTCWNENNALPIDIFTVTFYAINKNICWHHDVDRILKEIKPTLIHINSISLSMSFWYQLWAEKHGVKTVVVQGNYEVTRKPILKYLEILYNNSLGRILIKRTNGIGGKTKWACQFVESYYRREIMLTRVGLDVERFSKAKKIDWKKKLKLENNKILLYVGVLEPRRNPMFLVKIIEQLPDEYVLLLVGDGSLHIEIRDYIKEYGLEGRVLLLGRMSQEDLPSLYRACDLFLLASSYEIFGMVILESMFWGLPVISTLTAGSDTIIEDGVDSVIIPKFDVIYWTYKIQEVAENPKLLASMKNKAHNKIINELVWDKTVNEFIALYDKALNNG